MNSNKLMVKIIAKAYFAFSLLFGFYLMSHGHISHGAGFAGGVIIALGFIQALVILGDEVSAIINRDNARTLAVIGIAIFLLTSLAGYIYGEGFMSNFAGLGMPFSFLSSGTTIIYNITLNLAVIGCLLLAYLSLFEKDRG